MIKLGYIAATFGLALTGCGQEYSDMQSPQGEIFNTVEAPADASEFGFAQAMAPSPTIPGSGPSGDDIAGRDAARTRSAAERSQAEQADEQRPAVAPQIAYSYAMGFRVEADDLEALQERHIELCKSIGENCRVLSLDRSGDEDYGFGRLKLQVAASAATEFAEDLGGTTEGISAEQVSYAISGEDLTDNIIDTAAHLDGRRVLRDRLMEVLRSRSGTVAEIVEAERGVAAVNEEIDSATSRLANMRNRVAFSGFEVEYGPRLGENQVGFSRPISEAISSVGSTLGVTISAIIYALVALVPISALLLGLRWLWRKSGFRLRRQKNMPEEMPTPPQNP